jgi:hypothetical protein
MAVWRSPEVWLPWPTMACSQTSQLPGWVWTGPTAGSIANQIKVQFSNLNTILGYHEIPRSPCWRPSKLAISIPQRETETSSFTVVLPQSLAKVTVCHCHVDPIEEEARRSGCSSVACISRLEHMMEFHKDPGPSFFLHFSSIFLSDEASPSSSPAHGRLSGAHSGQSTKCLPQLHVCIEA